MNTEIKIKYFEYVLNGLRNWYYEKFNSNSNNDLSKLKVLKLLFFVSAVKSKSGENNSLLDNVFTTFFAMPYGHVESEIYSYINSKNGVLNYFIIDNQCTKLKDNINLNLLDNGLDPAYINLIDESIRELKKINPKLIQLSAFELVDISHTWYSWRKNYSNAITNSASIPVWEIKREDKVFSLQTI